MTAALTVAQFLFTSSSYSIKPNTEHIEIEIEVKIHIIMICTSIESTLANTLIHHGADRVDYRGYKAALQFSLLQNP